MLILRNRCLSPCIVMSYRNRHFCIFHHFFNEGCFIMEQQLNKLQRTTEVNNRSSKSDFLTYSVILPVLPSLLVFIWELVSGINIHFDELLRLVFCDSILLAFSFGVSLAAEISNDIYLYRTHHDSLRNTWVLLIIFLAIWSRFYESTSPENIKSVFVLVLWLIGVIASTVFTILCWKYKVESSKQYSETIKKQGDIICNLMERKNNSNN